MVRFTVPCAVIILLSCSSEKTEQHVMMVDGWERIESMSWTLPHEHVLVDFVGADSVTPERYNRDSAFNKILPFVLEYQKAGGKTIIECTPAYLGRDPELLLQLHRASGVQFITNTGYYGAAGEKFLPAHAFTDSAEQIARIWINEWKNGIDDTGVHPGFMKLGSDKGPLTPTQAKIVHAAAIAHLETGLTIAIHSGDGAAAQQELDILEEHGVSPQAFVWVHAQNEKDSTIHKTMAERGAWIEFDGLNANNLQQYVAYLKYAKDNGFLKKVLISNDAGWYHVGEPGGGDYRGYTTFSELLLPLLFEAGFTEADIKVIAHENPMHAFTVEVRKKD